MPKETEEATVAGVKWEERRAGQRAALEKAGAGGTKEASGISGLDRRRRMG